MTAISRAAPIGFFIECLLPQAHHIRLKPTQVIEYKTLKVAPPTTAAFNAWGAKATRGQVFCAATESALVKVIKTKASI